MRDIAAIAADIERAERARDDLLLSDDFAMTSGAWSRANSIVLALRRDLTAAQVAHIETQAKAITDEMRRIEALARDAFAWP